LTTVRWIRPAWLTIAQAQIYSSLPPHVLRALVVNKWLRREGTKIYRDSIDQVLLEASINRQVIFWGAASETFTQKAETQ
jgi:hypothetical protein